VRSDKDLNYEKLRNRGTGSHEVTEDYKIIEYPFDKYVIKIKLSPNNEFIEIVEIRINKEFLSYKQKVTSKGFHDVDEFYREE
jgi:hypothetical protein